MAAARKIEDRVNQETFDSVLSCRIDEMQKVLASKAKEYARGDRLHNFKRAAAMLSSTPERACLGMLAKHWVSILDMIDDCAVNKLPTVAMLNEKVGDCVNYLVLLEALIFERINDKYKGVPVDTKSRSGPHE